MEEGPRKGPGAGKPSGHRRHGHPSVSLTPSVGAFHPTEPALDLSNVLVMVVGLEGGRVGGSGDGGPWHRQREVGNLKNYKKCRRGRGCRFTKDDSQGRLQKTQEVGRRRRGRGVIGVGRVRRGS